LFIDTKKSTLFFVFFNFERRNSIASIVPIELSIFLKTFIFSNSSFLNKKSKTINCEIQLKGGPTQIKIWKELKRIKFGKTKTYGEIAKKYALSPRHIGKICGQNKIALIIPCHRVIRSDGSLGGFSGSGGVVLKKKLLNFEKN